MFQRVMMCGAGIVECRAETRCRSCGCVIVSYCTVCTLKYRLTGMSECLT